MRRIRRISTGLAAIAAALLLCGALAGAAAAAQRLGHVPPGKGPAPRITPRGAHGMAASTSYNWAGYSVSGGTYSSVTATWTQPSVLAKATETYALFWVGLDGDGSDTVEQIGTMGYTSGGRAYYTAWYEMYPAKIQQIKGFAVSPGDVLTATVQWTGSASFRLTLEDQTTGQTFTTVKSNPDATRTSAEVVAEAPSGGSGVLPLATFGLVAFSGCAVDGVSLGAAGAASIDMIGSGGVIAATSALGPDGAGFTVTDDFTPPTVTATNLQNSATRGWKNAPVKVGLKGSDGAGGSGVAAVYYTLDGGAQQTYSGAFTVSGAGSHAVRYWAVDRAGNTGAAKTGYVNLDLARPASSPAAVTLARRAATRGSLVAVRVAVTDPAPSSGAVTLVTRIVTRSGKTVARVVKTGVAVDSTRTVRVRLKSTLRRGVYTLRTVATDAAGNVQARAGTARLTVR